MKYTIKIIQNTIIQEGLCDGYYTFEFYDLNDMRTERQSEKFDFETDCIESAYLYATKKYGVKDRKDIRIEFDEYTYRDEETLEEKDIRLERELAEYDARDLY